METADGATGNRDEHHREYRVGGGGGVLVVKAFPHLGDGHLIDDEGHHDGDGHAQQQEAEDGIYLADQLVDGQQRGYQIIGKDNAHPDEDVPVGSEVLIQQHGGGVDKHGTDQNHQQHREAAHKLLHAVAEEAPVNLGQRCTVHAYRHKTGDEVVHGTGQYAAENNPQERRCAELSTHDGTADGAYAGDVEELYQKDAPRLHGHIIHSVGMLHGRSPAVGVNTDKLFYELGVKEISKQQQNN